MNEHAEKDQIDSHYATWWDEHPNYKFRNKWKPVVKEYFDVHPIPVNHEKFSLAFVIMLIPDLARLDERWKKFLKESFDPQSHKAH